MFMGFIKNKKGRFKSIKLLNNSCDFLLLGQMSTIRYIYRYLLSIEKE